MDIPKLACSVRLYEKQSGSSRLLGFADLTIGDAFVIHGVRIVETAQNGKTGGPFISFPARKGTSGAEEKWFEVVHPLTAEARAAAKECVLKAYQAEAYRAAKSAD